MSLGTSQQRTGSLWQLVRAEYWGCFGLDKENVRANVRADDLDPAMDAELHLRGAQCAMVLRACSSSIDSLSRATDYPPIHCVYLSGTTVLE
jgi:hypothetical protein